MHTHCTHCTRAVKEEKQQADEADETSKSAPKMTVWRSHDGRMIRGFLGFAHLEMVEVEDGSLWFYGFIRLLLSFAKHLSRVLLWFGLRC